MQCRRRCHASVSALRPSVSIALSTEACDYECGPSTEGYHQEIIALLAGGVGRRPASTAAVRGSTARNTPRRTPTATPPHPLGGEIEQRPPHGWRSTPNHQLRRGARSSPLTMAHPSATLAASTARTSSTAAAPRPGGTTHSGPASASVRRPGNPPCDGRRRLHPRAARRSHRHGR